jgi:S-formylglutathione hydrolase FrmB
METVVARDLVDEVDARFRTIATRDGRLLEGFSMGGYGVTRIGLRFPERFGAISALAGGPIDLDFDGPRARANPAERNRILAEVYGSDLEYYRRQSPLTVAGELATSAAPRPRIRIVVGDADNTRSASLTLHHRLDSLDIVHEYIELPGVGHDTMRIFAALGDLAWVFYAGP